jgi:8-oxo-dGTP pyrophosphatase MutT (NUDIX family)
MPKQTKLVAWKKLHSTLLLEHARMSIVEDDVELPDGNTTKYIYQTGIRDGVTVIAVRGNEILIQQEYSYPPDMVMYQFPGGGIEQGETPEQTAIRELKEESGYVGTPAYLGFYYPRNRLSSSKMHVVAVSDVTPSKKEGGDAEEFITSEWVSLRTLRTMIANGEIVNFSILAGMSLYDAKNTT